MYAGIQTPAPLSSAGATYTCCGAGAVSLHLAPLKTSLRAEARFAQCNITQMQIVYPALRWRFVHVKRKRKLTHLVFCIFFF